MIKKNFILCLILSNILYGNSLDDIKKLYNSKEYSKVCTQSGNIYMSFKDNEEFLNIFADSCLKSDMINRMILPIIKLNKTKQARENAAYFTTILYQKKLLYYALCDNADISYVNLPKTDYILSKIFQKYVKKEYKLQNNSYWFDDELDKDIKYKLNIEIKNGVKKMYLKTYKNGNLLKTRVYW